VNPLAFLSRWAAARGCSFWGIARSVAGDLEIDWRGDLTAKPMDWNELVEIMMRPPVCRAAPIPPGWTQTELGPLPPGWTVVDGKPVRT
jgi:hypothetical protein